MRPLVAGGGCEHADGLAAEVGEGLHLAVDAGADAEVGVIVALREVLVLQALVGDRDGGDRGVDAAGRRGREERLEAEVLELDLDAELLGDGVDEVDLEALEVAGLGLDLPGRVGGVGADGEGFPARSRGEAD